MPTYYIKPKLTLTANAAGATTDPGPASMAVSLSAAPLLNKSTVTALETFIYQTTEATVEIWEHTDAEVFVYLKNLATTASNNDIYIGLDNTGSPNDLTTAGNRFLTLSAGEFAYLPLSGQHDITCEGLSGLPKLEVWIFKTT
tara:strand:- start:953 stop:1381 length:429 start_codon:yes stop_codon:yes gene_type:complete